MANGTSNGTLKLAGSIIVGVLTALLIGYSLIVAPVDSRVCRLENRADTDAERWQQINRELGTINAKLESIDRKLGDE